MVTIVPGTRRAVVLNLKCITFSMQGYGTVCQTLVKLKWLGAISPILNQVRLLTMLMSVSAGVTSIRLLVQLVMGTLMCRLSVADDRPETVISACKFMSRAPVQVGFWRVNSKQ